MRAWSRYGLCGFLGAIAGLGAAVHTMRTGVASLDRSIGPWQTGVDFGTSQASTRTRAVLALRALFALPAREARFYNAVRDENGRMLDGRCSYHVTGGALRAQWWSLTLYSPEGYLIPNRPGIFSIGSAALPADQQDNWTVHLSPKPRAGHWLPTGGLERFELTLRVYLPADEGRGDPPTAALPRIARERCA